MNVTFIVLNIYAFLTKFFKTDNYITFYKVEFEIIQVLPKQRILMIEKL